MSPRSPTPDTSDFPLGIGKPALRALTGAGYSTLDQLTRAREADLLRLHGFGPKALRLLRAALAEQGKTFDTRKG
jgi:hypothetical protein